VTYLNSSTLSQAIKMI